MNKILRSKIILGLIASGLFSCSSAPTSSEWKAPINAENLFKNEDYKDFVGKLEILFGARQLKTIDLDQMNEKITGYIMAYRRSQDSSFLYRALVLTFSRPDDDGVREKVLTQLRSPIDENSEWRSGLVKMAMQSIYTVNDSASTAQEQMTAGIVLENILEEMQPDLRRQKSTGGFESNLVYSIAESEMSYSEKANNERKLALMNIVATPNKIAQRILTATK
jgi:hypothetical protein